MITADEIVNLYKIRRDAQGPLMRQMKQIQDLVNGDVIVPLNELDSNAKSNVANLVSIGLEQMSMRIASTMPVPYFPPLKEGQERAKELARNRKKAMLSIWDANRMSAKMRRRSRHMLARLRLIEPYRIRIPRFRTMHHTATS